MSKLFKNIAYNFLGQLGLMVLSLVSIKFVFTRLGGEVLGIIYFSTTVAAVLTAITTMGASTTVVREVAATRDRDNKYMEKVIGTASVVLWGSFALCALCVTITAPYLSSQWLRLQTLDETTVTTAIRLLGIAMLLGIPRSIYSAVATGFEKLGRVNTIEVGIVALQQAGTLVVLFMGGGVVEISLWYLMASLGGIIASLLVTVPLVPSGVLRPRFSTEVVCRARSFWSQMSLTSMLALLHVQADKIVISKVLPTAALGYYGVAQGIISKGTMVPSAIAGAAFPALSASPELQMGGAPVTKYGKLQDLVLLLSAPIYAAIIFFAHPVLTLVLDSRTATMLLIPVVILSIGSYMHASLFVPYMLSLAMGRAELGTRSNLWALLVTLPTTIILTYYFGIVGAAASWVVYNAFQYMYFLPRMCRECLSIRSKHWYLHVGRMGGLAITIYGPVFVIIWGWMEVSLAWLVIGYLLSTGVYVIGSWPLLGEQLRQSFKQTWSHYIRAAGVETRIAP